MNCNLTDKQIINIYFATEPTELLAIKYYVSHDTITNIKRKTSHKAVTKDITAFPGYFKSIPLTEKMITSIYLEENTYLYFLEKYKITSKKVKSIKSGQTYSHITKKLGKAGSVKKYKLTNQESVDIYNSNLPLDVIAYKYNICEQTVRNIKNVKTRKFFKEEY
jgi:hypothetical protein